MKRIEGYFHFLSGGLNDEGKLVFETEMSYEKKLATFHLKQVLPSDLTPDQVIEKVCEYLEHIGLDVSVHGTNIPAEIQKNKDRILE